jgi:hypothetical protein
VTLLLAGCGAAGQSVTESSEEMAAQQDLVAAYTASAEELSEELDQTLENAVETAEEIDCEQVCGLSFNICDLSDRICEISERHPTWESTARQCYDARNRCDIADADTTAVCDCEQYEFHSPVSI